MLELPFWLYTYLFVLSYVGVAVVAGALCWVVDRWLHRS